MGRPSKSRSKSATEENNTPPPPIETDFEEITELIWADEKDRYSSGELARRPRASRTDPCGCVSNGPSSGPMCCDDSCVLFACQEECPKNCEAGEACRNKRIQRKQWKSVEVFDAGPKGRGLRTLEPIRKGEFIIEYVGRAVRKAFLERLFAKYRQERMLYIMALDTDVYIDARKQGGTARYINHSCEPNCVVNRWKVRGALRAAIFATQDIAAGTELSFDYKWERKRGRAPTKCHCLAPSCRGTLELPKSMEELEEERQLLGHWIKPPSAKAGREIINRCIRIMSKEHQEYFAADVIQYDENTRKHFVMYRNLEEAWEDLGREDWMLLDEVGEKFVISKKSTKRDADVEEGGSSLIAGTQPPPSDRERLKSVKNYLFVQTPVKEGFISLGLLERCQRSCGVTISVLRCFKQNNKRIDQNSEEAMDEYRALQSSHDNSVWKLTISGRDVQKASFILGKNIDYIRRKLGLVSSTPSGPSEEVILPRIITDGVKRKLPSIREACGSNVSISFVPSESKSKQFARLLLEAPLQSELNNAKAQLWPQLLMTCTEMKAPLSPQGIYKDLGFFGGELSSEQFRLLVNYEGTGGVLGIAQDAQEDLNRSPFFPSFESAQRCTVWVQAEGDMGRIDGNNRRVNEAVPNASRKIYFGCEPDRLSTLWELVLTRAGDLARGVRYLHLGADRGYQQFMMQSGGQFFQFVEKVSGASVKVDPMTGDHLRIDGSATPDIIQIGDWDSEMTLNETDRAALAQELIILQIELYRDFCIRNRGLIFGRDWSLTIGTTPTDSCNALTATSSAPAAPSADSSVDLPRTPRSPAASRNSFDAKAVANACSEIGEIISALKLDSAVAVHSVIILYRYVLILGGISGAAGFKIREILLACVFMANKAQKVVKYRRMGAVLEAGYSVFYPGTKFDRKKEEVTILENRVVDAEGEILARLDFDVFYPGLDWIVEAAVKGGKLAEPFARNALELAVSGPVLGAGASAWLKFGAHYIFAAAVGLLAFPFEALFDALSLVPFKLMQVADMVAQSVKGTSPAMKRSSASFNGGKESILNNLDNVKRVCLQAMSKVDAAAAPNYANMSETKQRYLMIASQAGRRLLLNGVSRELVRTRVMPVIDGISAESNCKVSVGLSKNGNGEDIILEGNWRALAIAEYLLNQACEGHQSLPPPVDSIALEDEASKLQAKNQSGLLNMSSVNTVDAWEGTIQSSLVRDAPTWGRKVGGKACVAGKISEGALRDSGLRWWIPPRYGPSPTGSICDMFLARAFPMNETDKMNQVVSLSELCDALVGESVAKTKFPVLSSFRKENADLGGERSVAISMQRWPSERVSNKEAETGKRSQLGYSPAALQEMQILTELHSLLPSPRGHPNLILPIAIAQPVEIKNSQEATAGSEEFGKSDRDDIYSLFRSSEENERRAAKEKKRSHILTGPHILFHPTPFVLQRVISRGKKNRDDGLSPKVFAAWFHDMLSALVHCHANHVVLRALQADQIVIDHSGAAKLGGLYRATVLPPGERRKSPDPYRSCRKNKEKCQKSDDSDDVSSNPFIAPEILLGSPKHTKETDIWAIGALMANLLLNKALFVGKERSQMLVAMFKIVGTPGKENFPEGRKFPAYREPPKKYKRGVIKAFQHMMKEIEFKKHEKAIHLIAQMLHLDPEKRITAVDALKHECMMQYVEDCGTEEFRRCFVEDWMILKVSLMHSSKSEEVRARQNEQSAKREAMLMLAKTSTDGDDDDDLYNMDEILSPTKKKPRLD